MMPLYWTYGFDELSFERYFLITYAAFSAAAGDDSQDTTMVGR